jgi:hypothetical protein
MQAMNGLRNSATANALSAIRSEARFPHYVFSNQWDDFLFFDSYFLFVEAFIETKDTIFDEEASLCIALVNLGNAEIGSDPEPRSIYLDRSTTFSEYLSMLKGDGSPDNWLFLMDRYVCTSDKGNWCIYCEKQNDVAVLAVRRDFSTPTLGKLQALLEAESIKTLFASKRDRIFDNLVPEWRNGLATEYIARGW